MASESIRFDFLTTGGAEMARQFKNAGDNAGAAARGAKVLQDTIKSLGDKENRTAAESANLAKALRLTGDAEDRAAAKALGAEIAIKKLGEAEASASRKAGDVKGGFAGLAGELTGLGAAADTGGSKLKLALAGLNLASGILEPLGSGLVVAAGGLAAGLASAAAGLGAFGIVAQSVFSEASQAATKYAAAQQKYASATTSKQRVAALAAEKAAFAGLSPPVKALAVELGNAKKLWQNFTNAAAPGVVGVLSQGIGILTDHFGILGKFLPPVEKALSGLLAKVNTGLNSSGFTSFINALAQNSGPAITKLGIAIGNVVVGIGGILKAFLPTSQTLLSGLDKITAKFREWGTTLSGHSGFQSLMQTFRTETPQAVAILKNLAVVVGNVGKAMFGLSTFSNSKVLLQALLPLSGVLASLSKNTALDRIALYLYAAATAAGKLAPAFGGVKAAAAFFPGLWKSVVEFSGAVEGATAKEVLAAAATKVWAGAQAVLNAVMDVNPFVLIATAVIALGAAFIVAWKKSATFRDIIKEIGSALLEAGILVVKGDKIIVDSFLSMVGTILHGAADAFGWVPGLGSKLREASKSFDNFKAGTDNVFNGIIRTMQGWQNELGASKRTVDTTTAAIVKNFRGQGAAALTGRDDVKNYTLAVQENGARSDAARTARQRLITDLKNAGVNAQTANRLVDNLQAAISRMHGKTVPVGVVGSGKGGVVITTSGIAAAGQGNVRFHAASGAYVNVGSGPRADDVLARVSKGELIVPAPMVSSGAVDHLRGRIPGFAGGGLVGIENALGQASGVSATYEGRGAAAAMAAGVKAAIAKEKAAIQKVATSATVGSYKPGAGVQQWRGVVRQALGLAGANVAQLTDPVLYQMQTESGGNPTIVNKWDINWKEGHPSVGLMQVIRSTFQSYAGRFRGTGPFEYGVSVNPLANVYSAIKYAQYAYGPGLRNAYGGIGTGHGYDRGGFLPVGWSLAYNGTGRPEPVIPAGGSGGRPAIVLEVAGSGSGTFDAFLLKWIQEHVRIRGGGDVQTAFGRR